MITIKRYKNINNGNYGLWVILSKQWDKYFLKCKHFSFKQSPTEQNLNLESIFDW